MSTPHSFNNELTNVMDFCAEEVKRQLAGPQAVADMFVGWQYAAQNPPNSVTNDPKYLETFIRSLDAYILGGRKGEVAAYRTVPVYFGLSEVAMSWRNVPRAMESLCKAANDVEPSVFVFEFLTIHPFLDGNGRTAAILLNWLCKRMGNPLPLPDYFQESVKENSLLD